MRRVVVTGGAGFVGAHLVRALLAGGDAVAVLDNLDPDCGGDPANLEGLPIDWCRADLREPEAWRALVEAADLVFHAAARTSHRGSLKQPLLDAEVNLGGTLRLLEVARQAARPPRLVLCSTISQLGPILAAPAEETHPQRPIDLYSAHKAAAELDAGVYATAFGLSVASVRLTNLYGPRMSLRRADALVTAFLAAGLGGAPIPVFGEGRQLRNLLHIDDAVSALMAVAERDLGPGLTVLHVGHDEHHSIRDFAEAVARACGVRVKPMEWPAGARALEPGDIVVSNARARALLGWRPQIELETGLARTVAWYRGEKP